MAVNSPQNEDPAYITYLLDSHQLHDCHFLVGNPKLCKPERIGVLRGMLFAHSEVLRKEWSSGDIPVEDLYPGTFKNLLRYVYGFDLTLDLSFEDADNLLYAAEKYQIESLKTKLATRLIILLTPENICCLLNNPACFSVLQLENTITEILQQKTDKVFSSPDFLNLNPEALLRILKQTALNVPEVEIWRASLMWAKNRVTKNGPVSGQLIRSTLKKHVKHIRFCALDLTQFVNEVVPTGVLTDTEVGLVYVSKALAEMHMGLTEICNEILPRLLILRKEKLQKYYIDVKNVEFKEGINYNQPQEIKLLKCRMLTKDYGIDLLSFTFAPNSINLHMKPKGLTYECDCTITVFRINDVINNISTDPPLSIHFHLYVEYNKEYTVQFTGPIHLQPNVLYNFEIKYSLEHFCLWNNIAKLDKNHLEIELKTSSNMVKLEYRLVC